MNNPVIAMWMSTLKETLQISMQVVIFTPGNNGKSSPFEQEKALRFQFKKSSPLFT